MLLLIFLAGVASIVWARPLGRWKKQIDAEWKVDMLSESGYIWLGRVGGIFFCVLAATLYLAERFQW